MNIFDTFWKLIFEKYLAISEFMCNINNKVMRKKIDNLENTLFPSFNTLIFVNI